jgi:predicted nucleic acid-binding protein
MNYLLDTNVISELISKQPNIKFECEAAADPVTPPSMKSLLKAVSRIPILQA